MAQCKLCLQDRVLVKGHVLSDFLYDEVYDRDTHKFHQLHTDPTKRNLTRPTGFYETMMCHDCDNRIIGTYETYASQVFKGGVEIVIEQLADRIVLSQLNYQKFKLFLVSLIWRCAVTVRDEFKETELPAMHLERMRLMIWNGHPGEAHDYGCVVMMPELYDELKQCILPPDPVRISGHHCYRLLAGGFWWLFVVSNHSDRFEKAELFLSKDGILNIMRERASTDYMRKMAVDLVRNPTYPGEK